MSHVDTADGYLALPPVALPAPRRQLLVGTALACLAGSTLVGGMLGDLGPAPRAGGRHR